MWEHSLFAMLGLLGMNSEEKRLAWDLFAVQFARSCFGQLPNLKAAYLGVAPSLTVSGRQVFVNLSIYQGSIWAGPYLATHTHTHLAIHSNSAGRESGALECSSLEPWQTQSTKRTRG